MRALECGFALGYWETCNVAKPYWVWIRQSLTSDTWEIEYGGVVNCGLSMYMRDLICYPWKWHVGLVSDGFWSDTPKGDFEVTIEDTLPWIIK
jgi:hypothetical protein